MKAREALVVFERALETGFCVSLRGFAACVGVVPSTIVNWKNNPEKELRGIEATKVQYVREEVEKFEPEFIDWSSFRREAAKVAMQGILASGDDGWSLTLTECYKPEEKHSYPIGIARLAVACADELIKQLKEDDNQ